MATPSPALAAATGAVARAVACVASLLVVACGLGGAEARQPPPRRTAAAMRVDTPRDTPRDTLPCFADDPMPRAHVDTSRRYAMRFAPVDTSRHYTLRIFRTRPCPPAPAADSSPRGPGEVARSG
jgi:hypothetical protein